MTMHLYDNLCDIRDDLKNLRLEYEKRIELRKRELKTEFRLKEALKKFDELGEIEK